MLGAIFSSIGGAVGKFFGGGFASSVGRFIGKWAGDFLEQEDDITYYQISSGTIENFFPVSYASGRAIPLVFGKSRVYGQLIWSDIIQEIPLESSTYKYFKKNKANYIKVDFLYYCNFAISICEGKIEELQRVWCNGELIELSDYDYALYYGSEEQMPDPLISSHFEQGKCPAFRDLAYIVFKDFPLIDFGNTIPVFSFEILRKPNIASCKSTGVESKINALNIIPGSGEFVYDTIIQTKTITLSNGNTIEEKINSNNKDSIADVIYSFNYLQRLCPNIEWASPVVCWFTDSLDISECSIFPAVEYNFPNATFSENWEVAGRTRNNAREISKNARNSPNYGGTVNDASVVRYIKYLKHNRVKVMFYPMIFTDLPEKPWRGHITGNASDIHNFFNKRDGYNNFIKHYANLLKNDIDAFIIGSELIGITSIRDGNRFPAIEELINLAREVKQIVGPSVLVTYAADWSEYHHTEGGWYNLDELWACESIDFIAIDNYMPLTNSQSSEIAAESIKEGFCSGEGFNYFEDNGNIHNLEAPYAWKNIRWWWENEHINPDGNKTKWKPRSKKIWFAEFGFPSIDKATNQPNIFYDPESRDGGVPKHSTGAVNLNIQRKAINEFIDYWQSQEFVENMFLWCFDARPYPQWPHSKKWADGNLWPKGHWINGKLGQSQLLDVLLEISERCEITEEKIFSENLDQSVHGIQINKKINANDLIDLLKTVYCITSIDFDSCIKFQKKNEGQIYKIDQKHLIPTSDKNKIEFFCFERNNIPGSISLNFKNIECDYQNFTESYIGEEAKYNHIKMTLPLSMNRSDAFLVSKNIIKGLLDKKLLVNLFLPINYIYLKVGDFLKIFTNELNKNLILKILKIEINNFKINIIASASSDHSSSLDDKDLTKYSTEDNILPFIQKDDGFIKQIKLPLGFIIKSSNMVMGNNEAIININNIYEDNYISSYFNNMIFFINTSKQKKDLKICKQDKQNFINLKTLKPSTTYGFVKDYYISDLNNFYNIDYNSYIEVYIEHNPPEIGEYDLRYTNSLAYAGGYLFFFGKVTKLDENTYRFSRIIWPSTLNASKYKKTSNERTCYEFFNFADIQYLLQDSNEFFILDKTERIELSQNILFEKFYYKSGDKIKKIQF